MEYKTVDGIRFKKDKGGYYKTTMTLHVFEFWKAFGYIPEYPLHLHHIDGNKENNDVSNLWLLTNAEHRILHQRLEYEKVKTCVDCGCEFHNSHVDACRCQNCQKIYINNLNKGYRRRDREKDPVGFGKRQREYNKKSKQRAKDKDPIGFRERRNEFHKKWYEKKRAIKLFKYDVLWGKDKNLPKMIAYDPIPAIN